MTGVTVLRTAGQRIILEVHRPTTIATAGEGGIVEGEGGTITATWREERGALATVVQDSLLKCLHQNASHSMKGWKGSSGSRYATKLIALLVNRNGCECHIFNDSRLFLSFAYKPSLRRQNFVFYCAQLRSVTVTNEHVAVVVQSLSFFKKPARKSKLMHCLNSPIFDEYQTLLSKVLIKRAPQLQRYPTTHT